MSRLRLLRAPTNRLCTSPGLCVLPAARRLCRRDRWIWLLPKSQIRVQTETLTPEPALAMDIWPCGGDDAIRADVRNETLGRQAQWHDRCRVVPSAQRRAVR